MKNTNMKIKSRKSSKNTFPRFLLSCISINQYFSKSIFSSKKAFLKRSFSSCVFWVGKTILSKILIGFRTRISTLKNMWRSLLVGTKMSYLEENLEENLSEVEKLQAMSLTKALKLEDIPKFLAVVRVS
jgi:hypothetical protein